MDAPIAKDGIPHSSDLRVNVASSEAVSF